MGPPGSAPVSFRSVAHLFPVEEARDSRFSVGYLLFLSCAMQRLPPQEAPVKFKIYQDVVSLGSRLGISCVLDHQSSSGSSGITNSCLSKFRDSRLSVRETDVIDDLILKFRSLEQVEK